MYAPLRYENQMIYECIVRNLFLKFLNCFNLFSNFCGAKMLRLEKDQNFKDCNNIIHDFPLFSNNDKSIHSEIYFIGNDKKKVVLKLLYNRSHNVRILEKGYLQCLTDQ